MHRWSKGLADRLEAVSQTWLCQHMVNFREYTDDSKEILKEMEAEVDYEDEDEDNWLLYVLFVWR